MSDSGQGTGKRGPRYQKSVAEILQIIEQHRLFVARKGGARADLTMQSLAGAKLPALALFTKARG